MAGVQDKELEETGPLRVTSSRARACGTFGEARAGCRYAVSFYRLQRHIQSINL
jgi:hypothetical protein